MLSQYRAILQKQPRTGWVYRGVEKPESIADHMYRMAILALTVAGTEYDQSKLVKMAIVHDLAEAIVGDITPVDGMSGEEKYSRELAALKEIQTMIGMETAVAHEVGELWCAPIAPVRVFTTVCPFRTLAVLNTHSCAGCLGCNVVLLL